MINIIVAEEKNGIKKIAGLDNGRLVEFAVYDENKANEGNIYIGKIVKKITSANNKVCYFVNIGKEDVFINAQERDLEDLQAHEGQDIILQITQEAHNEKNARGVRFLQLAGNNLVYCPYGEQIDISSKITDEDKCEKLYNLINENTSEDGGWIVRTHATEADEKDILSEITDMKAEFKEIMDKAKTVKSPALLLAKDSCLEDMIARNAKNLEKIVLNNHITAKKWEDKFCVEYNALPMEEFGIDEQLTDALQKEIKLRSGGRIFIEETKALTAIDVDSGGCSEQGGIGRLNNEAAEEIARQIILRNLSGKIVIDFAGFAEYKFLKSALDVLEKGLAGDACKSRVLGVTKAGNVEILRSRRRPSLSALLTIECESCRGTGRVEK